MNIVVVEIRGKAKAVPRMAPPKIWREAPAAAQALARSARPNLALAGAKRINNYANIEVLWSLIPKNFLSARFARGVCVDLCMFCRARASRAAPLVRPVTTRPRTTISVPTI